MATKKKRPHRSKADMLSSIYASFAAKSPVTYDERVLLAKNAYGWLDEMMVKPTFNGFRSLVEVMNLFVQLIHATDTDRKCLVRHKCPNAHEWLYERVDEGEPVAQTINDCQMALENVLARFNRTGSWALDSATVALLEKCFKWYEWTTSVMPRAVLADCMEHMDKVQMVDTPQGKRCRIAFTELDKAYIEKEKQWNSVPTISS